jgi:hypothetical protein
MNWTSQLWIPILTNIIGGLLLWCSTPLIISYILAVSFMGETGAPGENRRLAASHLQTFSHNVLLNTPCHERDSMSQL